MMVSSYLHQNMTQTGVRQRYSNTHFFFKYFVVYSLCVMILDLSVERSVVSTTAKYIYIYISSYPISVTVRRPDLVYEFHTLVKK
jgi:hypothetical protein